MYKRREPQGQVLHHLVREHLEPFLAYTREHYRKPPLPADDESETVCARQAAAERANNRVAAAVGFVESNPVLSHVTVPREPVPSDEPAVLYYDVTGEPVPSRAQGLDPGPDERGPPDYDELVDPPAPEM